MNNAFTSTLMPWVRAAIIRRIRRGSWAYIPWLLVWLPPLIWMAGNLSFNVRATELWPVLIPILAVAIQIIYPTLLGWAILFIPSIFFAGGALISVIITAPVRIHKDQFGALLVSSIAALVYLMINGALWFALPGAPQEAIAKPAPATGVGPSSPPEA